MFSLFGLAGNADSQNFKARPDHSERFLGNGVSTGPGPQFAIADFDGDHQPDLARIQAVRTTTGAYSIHLRLSGKGEQSIQVVAPGNGLQIEARDVNADNSIDLVIVSAWFGRPVAIFLNDGHGGFSRIEPSALPEAFTDGHTALSSARAPAIDAVGLPSQSRAQSYLETRAPPHVRSRAKLSFGLNAGFVHDPFSGSHAGRAPPREINHT